MGEKKRISMVIADDHPVVRIGVRTMLEREFDLTLYEASNGDELYRSVRDNRPDLVLMDVNMPNTSSQDTLQSILLLRPGLNVLMFSVHKEEIYGKLHLMLGARGYIQKDSLRDELVCAINCVLSDKVYMKKDMQPFYFGKGSEIASPYAVLSKKEVEVMQCLVRGDTVMGIARDMNLSPSTVGTHKAHIFEKMRVGSTMELKELASLHPLG